MEEYVVYRYNKNAKNDIEWSLKNVRYGFGKNISHDFALVKKKLLFFIASKGRYRICYVRTDNDELIHYSFIIPYCAKFSFMKMGDICIGPCWTKESYRGKGIYGSVLNLIVKTILKENPNANLYVLIRTGNIASIKGIHKTNFIPVGKCTKSKFLKYYRKVIYY